ncbi:MAG: rhomboid family intramembrane serine protease [Candidatus Eisenbacteria bacterium]|nr:rhomboid family intramembrane serine protease [Candidatus Eisenbacteria bacterium]
MSYRSTDGSPGAGIADRLTPGVRVVIIACALIFVVQMLFHGSGPVLERLFGLVPADLFGRWHLWQPLTYQFLHGSLFHLLFNMLSLFMFGGEIEGRWGTPAFLRYFLVCGAGAGLTHWIVGMDSMIPVIGASGAIFGVLLAYGMMFPDRTILLWFVIPIPARYLVILFGFIELVGAASGPADGVARFAHLGGLLTGFLYLKNETLFRPLKKRLGVMRKSREDGRRAAVASRQKNRQAAIDAILEKIQRDGMGALTEREKQTLREAAERGREPRR